MVIIEYFCTGKYHINSPINLYYTFRQRKCNSIIQHIFFFRAGLRDPIPFSLLSGGITSHNSGYKFNRLCPYIMLVCYFLPPPSLPARNHSWGIPSSSPIFSSMYNYAAAAVAILFAPSKYIPACSHHRQDTLASSLQAECSQRSRISLFVMYCATVF